MTDLAARSVSVILDSQAPSGAYPAATRYATYGYCWFRDGSYIAHAMDLAGRPDSAARFHTWVAEVISGRAELIQRVIARSRQDLQLGAADVLHTRYTLDGQDATVEWPNFQLDGLGTWLWSLSEHSQRAGRPLLAGWREAADLVAAYLEALWEQPCYDLWEEFPQHIHTYTLAAIYGGLAAHAELEGADHEEALEAIATYVHRKAVVDGCFTKYIGSREVDASLVGLATPYRIVEPDHPTLVATLARMEGALWRRGTGVHRYSTDVFYGGGEWVVLAGWLGWHYAAAGDHEPARALLDWIEAQADPSGDLPEQVAASLIAPAEFDVWTARWGPIAKPLLWSHASYLILRRHLE